MSERYEKHIGNVPCVGDDGRQYDVAVFIDMIVSRDLDGTRSEVEGLKSFYTNGGHVNSLGNGQYKIVQTGVILTAVSGS